MRHSLQIKTLASTPETNRLRIMNRVQALNRHNERERERERERKRETGRDIRTVRALRTVWGGDIARTPCPYTPSTYQNSLNRFPRSTHAPAFPPRTLTSSTRSSLPTSRMIRRGRGEWEEGTEWTGKVEEVMFSVSFFNKQIKSIVGLFAVSKAKRFHYLHC